MAIDIDFDVNAVLAKLGEFAQAHGQQAIDLAAKIKQVNAVGDVVGNLVGMTGGALVFYLGGVTVVNAYKRRDDFENIFMEVILPAFGGLACIASAVVATAGLLGMLDPWMWVALFDPKLALAHDIYTKLLH